MSTKFFILTVILLVNFCLICCSGSNKINEENTEVYYFDFDKVYHYGIKIGSTEIDSLRHNKDSISANGQLLQEILTFGTPVDINDTSFVLKLEDIGYTKNELPEEDFEIINNVFREKGPDPNSWMAMCMPEFRDILIFKKEARISGMVKICFGCQIVSIVGTNANTENFGSFGAYDTLRNLFYKK